MKIISINVALPTKLRYGERQVITGGDKRPIAAAMLRTLNFEGDCQADLVNHGGADKAVCVYAFDHYSYWQRTLGRAMTPGAFSENLTVEGATDDAVCIGDVYRIGEALVQVSQPRQPCSKLAARNGEKHFVKMVQAKGTGFYMRVLQEGVVNAGDAFELVQPHPTHISIAKVNDILYGRSKDQTLIEQLAHLPEYTDYGRSKMAQRLLHTSFRAK